MNTLIRWDYDKSVSEVRELLGNLKIVTLKKATLTDDVARKLYEAREELSDRGSWSRNNCYNWNQYLEDCGLQRMTVHRWLDRYEPKEQRLLSDSEYDEKQKIKQREKMQIEQANKNRVSDAIRTGAIPEDWNNDCKKMYEAKIKENAERDERKEKVKEKMNKQKEERENRQFQYQKESEEFSEILLDFENKENEKIAFMEKIKLSGDNAEHSFNSALMDYLNILPTDSQKIEACHNIIKICKGIVSELQSKSIK